MYIFSFLVNVFLNSLVFRIIIEVNCRYLKSERVLCEKKLIYLIMTPTIPYDICVNTKNDF